MGRGEGCQFKQGNVVIIVTKPGTSDADIAEIRERVEALGVRTHLSKGEFRSIIGCVGDIERLQSIPLLAYPGVEEVLPVAKPFKLASKEFSAGGSAVRIGDSTSSVLGGEDIVVIAGPCAVESMEQMEATGLAVKKAGANAIRGGAFKPRTSPYSFQGLGVEGLEILKAIREKTGLPVVTEVTDPRLVELVAAHADVLQVGARNMQNFALLAEVGKVQRPVLLKRGISATIKEFLLAAEYVMNQGNRDVILCERGIRTYGQMTRNTFDVAAVPVLKRETHLPVIVDPSHAAGIAHLVTPLAYAGIAAGADGLIIEVHPDPPSALSDGNQSLTFDAFNTLMDGVKRFAEAAGRRAG